MHKLLRCPLQLLGLTVVLALPAFAYAHGDEEHGDHDAQHDGFVMMYMDLHFEVVLVPTGGVQLYYTDATRAELPAATVSDVAVEIEYPGSTIETISMSMSAAGDFWEGSSKPVSDPAAIVRVGFLYQGDPLLLDVPVSALIPAPAEEAADTVALFDGHDANGHEANEHDASGHEAGHNIVGHSTGAQHEH